MQILSRDSSKFHEPWKVFHERGIHDPDMKMAAANERLCAAIMRVLLKHYNCPFWCIEAAHEHGIVKVWLQGFAQWPYVVHIATLKSDPGFKCIVRAGGELLERFRIPRNSFSVQDYLVATRKMPHHFNRNKKAPV